MVGLFLLLPVFLGFSSSGSIGAFLKPLSKEEEEKFIIQYQDGTEEEKKQAKDALVLHNLRLVAHIAKKYHNSQREPEELLSVGIVGLIKAIISYNTEKSIRLATYASKCIENEILMALRLGKKSQNDISLHEPIGTDRDGNEIVMLDIINSNTPDFADVLDISLKSEKMIHSIQEVLTKREQTVIVLRYGLGTYDTYTQQEIAKVLGISRSYVSRIEKKALKKMNAFLSQ